VKGLTELGFMAGPSSCGKVSQMLTELCLGLGDTEIMDLLSNFAFLGTDGDRMPHSPLFNGKENSAKL
jgi:hypothetical protein